MIKIFNRHAALIWMFVSVEWIAWKNSSHILKWLTIIAVILWSLLMMPGISQWWYSRDSALPLSWPVEWLYGGCWWSRISSSTAVLSTHAWCAASALAAVTSKASTAATVWYAVVRVTTGHGKSWNLGRQFSGPGKSLKMMCLMEFFYNSTEQFHKSDTNEP